MADGVRIANYQRPVELLDIAERGKQTSTAEKPDGDTFKEMFSRELAEDRSVMFSKHASQRLFSRNIELSAESLNKIADAIDKAAEKGSKETLILTDDAALVVSIKDRTVVTAFDRDHLREGVVTAIDSAVIL
jgi:flagellar operon protein